MVSQVCRSHSKLFLRASNKNLLPKKEGDFFHYFFYEVRGVTRLKGIIPKIFIYSIIPEIPASRTDHNRKRHDTG